MPAIEKRLGVKLMIAGDCMGEKAAEMAKNLKPGEVMLLENFEEDYLGSVGGKLEQYSLAYRQTYTDASFFIEEQSKTSVRAGLLGGVAAAGKGLGQRIGSVPLIKEGPVDELLTDGGEALEGFRDDLTRSDVATLTERRDSCVEPFK